MIQKNMTLSGKHDSNVGKNGLSTLGCYYFLKLCNDNPEVDIHFSQEIDEFWKGDMDEIEPMAKGTGLSEKKRA